MAGLADWLSFFNGLFPNAPVTQQYAKTFADNDLDPRVGDMITLEMLESLGIKSLGHRLMIKKALTVLSEKNPFPLIEVSSAKKDAAPSVTLQAPPADAAQSTLAPSSSGSPLQRVASPREDRHSHKDRKEKAQRSARIEEPAPDKKEKKQDKAIKEKKERKDSDAAAPAKEKERVKEQPKVEVLAAPLQRDKSSSESSEFSMKTGSNGSSSAKGSSTDTQPHQASEGQVPKLTRLCIRAFREEKTARHAYKSGDFHRVLVMFKQELPAALGQPDKRAEEQMLQNILHMNLPSQARRPSRQEVRTMSTQAARARIKCFGSALSGFFLYQPMRENMIVDIGVETILRVAQQGILKVHKELSWHHTFAIAKKEQIGVGATAVVYRMELPGKGDIALKVFSDKDQDAYQTCRTELAFASICSHPNLVNTFGGCTSAVGSYAVAMEYCARGTLYELLRDAELTLSWSQRLQLARGIAMGLAYVHSLHIIHRDVKSLNVLITKDLTAKLTDFGASTILAPTMSQGIGSIMWMAPEVLKSKEYSEKADIYSFGIVMWEICERDLPYPNMRSYQIEKHVLEKKRPPIAPSCPQTYSELMQSLWEHRPEKRPSAFEATAALEALLRAPWVNMPLSASEIELQHAGSKGFSMQERQLILDSWQLLADRHQQLITLFYARFFELLPEVRKLFDHVSNDRMSKKIARTITAVLAGLSTESVKEADAQKAQKDLYALGTRHQRYGAKPEYVPAFKEAFLYALGHDTMLGNHFTTPTRLAWAKGLKLAADVVGAGLQGKADKPCRIQ